MKRRIYIIAATVITVALTLSCTEELDDNNNGQVGKQEAISFTATADQDWYEVNIDTRSAEARKSTTVHFTEQGADAGLVLQSTVVNGINSSRFGEQCVTRGIQKFDMSEDFWVSAFEYPAANGWQNTYTPNKFYNLQATYNNSTSTWTLPSTEYWPAADKAVQFFAYAPAANTHQVLSSNSTQGRPAIDFTVEQDVYSQTDLMTAISGPKTYEYHVKANLPFKHALTCVKFAMGSSFKSGCTIKSLKVEKVAYKGVVTINDPVEWNVDETLRTFFLMDELDFSSDANMNTIIAPTGGERYTTMLMIPQTLPSDARLVMVYNNGSKDIEVAASLANQIWLPGTTVTYSISATENSMDYVITASATPVGHRGGTATFSVTSYAVNGDGLGKTPIPWEVVGYSDDGGVTFHREKPASCNWAAIVTTSGNGGTAAEEGLALLTAQKPVGKDTLDADEDVARAHTLMSTRGAKGTNKDPYDLSTHDYYGNNVPRTTANCYIVNSPGYYKFPLIYGCAIKNGAKNESAYNGGCDFSYKGDNTLTTPYIKDNGTPKDAILCWQDADEMIITQSTQSTDNVRLVQETDGEYYVYFKVNRETLYPGNALIAVRDTEGTIMWSWHIWCTNIDPMAVTEITNHKGYKYSVMPTMLGFCSLGGTVSTYAQRSMTVKVQQSSGKTATFTIQQSGGDLYTHFTDGYAVYYQWGRKDPFPGLTSKSNNNTHPLYPTTSTYLFTQANKTTTIDESITRPYEKVYNNGAYWASSWPWGLWDSDNSQGTKDGKVIKTVYDPCPPGFCVPPGNAFSGFTTDGSNHGWTTFESNYFRAANNQTADVDGGFYFYTNDSDSETYFVPIFGGYRQWSDTRTTNNGYGAFYWCANAVYINPTYRGLNLEIHIKDPAGSGNNNTGVWCINQCHINYGANLIPILEK